MPKTLPQTHTPCKYASCGTKFTNDENGKAAREKHEKTCKKDRKSAAYEKSKNLKSQPKEQNKRGVTTQSPHKAEAGSSSCAPLSRSRRLEESRIDSIFNTDKLGNEALTHSSRYDVEIRGIAQHYRQRFITPKANTTQNAGQQQSSTLPPDTSSSGRGGASGRGGHQHAS